MLEKLVASSFFLGGGPCRYIEHEEVDRWDLQHLLYAAKTGL